MSEDVKPREWTLYPCMGLWHVQNDDRCGRGLNDTYVKTIELEPTLQLMDEMAEAIINEARLDSKEEVLEKYRNFKESLK